MRKVLAGTLVVVSLALAGCGGGGSSPSASANGEASKSAQQVLTDAVNAAKGASSLHLGGSLTASGKAISLDLSVAKGKGATGSITLNGAKIQLVVIGTNGYMNADAAAFTQFAGARGAAIAQLVAGRWLKFPLSNAQFQPLVAFSNPNGLFEQLQSGADSALKNNGATTYKGQSVVALDDGAKNGTLYVAATGTPYPLALVKSGTGGGEIDFGEWNQSVTLSAPSGAVDLSQLGG